MKKLGALFYFLLAILSIAVLIMLSLWARTGKTLYLFLMIGAFGVYLLFIVFSLLYTWKDLKTGEAVRSKYLMLLNHFQSEFVYLAYLGTERRLISPSKTRKDYLVEFFEPSVDPEMLKKHLSSLSEAEEDKLREKCVGSEIVPFSYLSEMQGKKVFLSKAVFEAAQPLRHFDEFFKKNELIQYGE